MSKSLIYPGLGAKGYTLISTRSNAKGTIFKLEPQKRLFICPVCKSTEVTTRGSVDRTLKTLSIGKREDVYLDIKIPRLHCHSCGKLRYMDTNISEPRKSYTYQLADYVSLLSQVATLNDIVFLTGLSWYKVNDITKDFLTKKYSKPDLRNLTRISIYEISTHKDHKYLTVVINADTGQPIYVGKGKSASSLDGFWTLLGKRRAQRIQAVAIDMGKAYISAVKERLPHADIVFDHFHLIKP
jgi:transposase